MTLNSLLPDERRGSDLEDPEIDEYETERTFDSLGVGVELVKALADQGITTAFPIQALTVADGLEGRDVCGKAKTGSGKTLAFGLPLLQRCAEAAASNPPPKGGDPRRPQGARPPAHPRARPAGPRRPRAARRGGRPAGRRRLRRAPTSSARWPSCASGVEVVIATPGRLIDLGDRGELTVADVEVLVLDEADRMADMGFMPQVEWVLRRLERPHQTLLFSATLDGAVDRLVTRYMNDPVFHEVASSTQTVAAMEHRFLKVHQMDKVKVAAAICRRTARPCVRPDEARRRPPGRAARARRASRCAAIHGDLRQANRERALDRLLLGQAARARGDRRRRPRPAHRRGRHRHALRPARGPQGLPAPVRPHRPGRGDGRRRDAAAVEPAGRGRGHPAAARAAPPDRRDLLQRPAPRRPGRTGSRRRRRERAL